MKELTTEELEIVIKLLTQLKSYLLSGETFDFGNELDEHEGFIVEEFIEKLKLKK